MIVNYYRWDNWGATDGLDTDLMFGSVDSIKKHTLEHFKFTPHFVLRPGQFLSHLQVEKPDFITETFFKTYKTGKKKGEYVLDKTGQRIVLGENRIPTTKIVKDYSKYNVSLDKFRDSYQEYEGYYEFSYDILSPVVTDTSIKYAAQVFITFVTAVKHYSPEIKIEGQPYQPLRITVEEKERSERFPLNQCEHEFGIALNMSAWRRTKPHFIECEVSWSKTSLEIID